MKTLIIYASIHNGNTEKVARAMAEVLDAKLVKPNEIKTDESSEYDLIGFGSGIYFGKHHKSLLDLVSKLQPQNNKKAFIFSTRGIFPVSICHKALKKQLLEKEFEISFYSRGLVTVTIEFKDDVLPNLLHQSKTIVPNRPVRYSALDGSFKGMGVPLWINKSDNAHEPGSSL